MSCRLLGFATVLAVCTGTVSAAVITVDLNGTGQFTAIQPAIDAAKDGDTVLVKPGEYVITEPINFNRLHDPENPASPPVRNIVVRSEGGAEVTVIRMASPEVYLIVVSFKSGETDNSVLDGFKLNGGLDCGVKCENNSSPTLINCTISGNHGWGGGLSCWSSSSPSLTNCTISGNTGTWGGVGLHASSPTLTNCTISANDGSGVSCLEGSSPTLTNCRILGNNSAGVYCCWDSSPTLTNCTISGNWGGGVGCDIDSGAKLTNCIVWRNRIGGEEFGFTFDATYSYSCIESVVVWPGVGNINTDPLFVQPGHWNDSCLSTNADCLPYEWQCYDIGCVVTAAHRWIPGDYHLQPGSPAIDAGTCEGAPGFDVEWQVRPAGNGCDMGANEFDGAVLPAPVIALVGPAEGSELGGTRITVIGVHFAAGAVVHFGGVAATEVVVDSQSDIRCTIPRHSPGVVGVEVMNPDGQSGALDNAFTFLALPHFRRGDANASNAIDIADAIFTLTYLFAKGPAPSCADAADANDSGVIDIADAIALLSHLFAQAGPLPSPFGECGIDPTTTDDTLDCLSFAPCEGP